METMKDIIKLMKEKNINPMEFDPWCGDEQSKGFEICKETIKAKGAKFMYGKKTIYIESYSGNGVGMGENPPTYKVFILKNFKK